MTKIKIIIFALIFSILLPFKTFSAVSVIEKNDEEVRYEISVSYKLGDGDTISDARSLAKEKARLMLNNEIGTYLQLKEITSDNEEIIDFLTISPGILEIKIQKENLVIDDSGNPCIDFVMESLFKPLLFNGESGTKNWKERDKEVVIRQKQLRERLFQDASLDHDEPSRMLLLEIQKFKQGIGATFARGELSRRYALHKQNYESLYEATGRLLADLPSQMKYVITDIQFTTSDHPDCQGCNAVAFSFEYMLDEQAIEEIVSFFGKHLKTKYYEEEGYISIHASNWTEKERDIPDYALRLLKDLNNTRIYYEPVLEGIISSKSLPFFIGGEGWNNSWVKIYVDSRKIENRPDEHGRDFRFDPVTSTTLNHAEKILFITRVPSGPFIDFFRKNLSRR